MSTAYQLYTTLLPQALRKHLDPLQLRFHVWKKKTIKRYLSAPSVLRARRTKLRNIMSKRPLKVAFQVAQISKWKCESVLRLMQEDTRFEPFIWCVPVSGVMHLQNPALHEQEVNRIVSFFTQRNIRVCTYPSINKFPADERPDLIFIHEAYDAIFPSESFQGLTKELLCYVPYGYHNSTSKESLDGIGNNIAIFNFYENPSIKTDASPVATNGGRNIYISGHPMADLFATAKGSPRHAWKDCEKPMKRVIWAPHWSITSDLSWFTSGTFLKNAQGMLDLAIRYKDEIQFSFKPHPHLYRVLSDLPGWGKEKTKDYYRQWEEMPNTQLDEGDYAELFMHSDAMIHDSGSFILEYLYADKPCMFLIDGEGYSGYNQMTKAALNAYHQGLTEDDIDHFLRTCVCGGEDSKKETRQEVLKTYLLPPNGVSAAENIVNALCHAQ